MSNEIIIIDTNESLDEFFDRIARFHDALIREVGIVNRGYVDESGSMYGDMATCDARLVFHSQYRESPCIEIVLEELRSFRLAGEGNHVLLGDAYGVFTPDGISVFIGDAPNQEDLMFSARSMKYKILGPELLGDMIRTVKPIVGDEQL